MNVRDSHNEHYRVEEEPAPDPRSAIHAAVDAYLDAKERDMEMVREVEMAKRDANDALNKRHAAADALKKLLNL